MRSTSHIVVVILAVAIFGCGSATDDAGQRVKVAFLHFDGQNVLFERDNETVFESVLTTPDHTVGLSHLVNLSVKNDSTIKWTVDGQEFGQRLQLNPKIGVIFITLGRDQADLFEGDEVLLD